MISSLVLSLGGKFWGLATPSMEHGELIGICAQLAPRSELAAVSSAAVSLLVCL